MKPLNMPTPLPTGARRPVWHALAVLLALMLAGCATGNVPQGQSEGPRRIVADTLPDGSIRADTDDARIAELWGEAELARANDQLDVALEHLFDALEINPRNSLLWSRAAELQLALEESVIAENYALKSNMFAGANPSLLHRNWLIIEHARSLRGDLLGVRSAHKKVTEYQYR